MRRIPLRLIAALAAALLLLGACSDPDSFRSGGPDPTADLGSPDEAAAAEIIPGRYIVMLDDAGIASQSAQAFELSVRSVAAQLGVRAETTLRVIGGFVAVGVDDAQLRRLENDPRVVHVEPDRIMRAVATQSNAPWGLDRVDQRDRPLDGDYSYDDRGSGVHAYIIDTGIRTSHNEFSGRIGNGFTAISDGRGVRDCNGHGTHVAGTVGGSVYGVAKSVTLHPVRVLGCDGSGSNSGVIAGVDWVTRNAARPAVANMSLGGGASTALDTAVRNSVASGVVYALAAGNESTNACNRSPARTAEGITVGATTSSDARSSFSNFGSCLDLFAPGSSITSAWSTGNNATRTISGTSMAAPHVAGAVALYLEDAPGASPAQVANAIVGSASAGRIRGEGSGSPDLLLYTGSDSGGGGGGGGGTPPPDAERYSGSLSGSGDYDYQPNGSYYYSGSGTHTGALSGPGSADFDLFLWRWNGRSWSVVGRSESPDSNESISYGGSAGYYLWRVVSYRGSGSYTLDITRP